MVILYLLSPNVNLKKLKHVFGNMITLFDKNIFFKECRIIYFIFIFKICLIITYIFVLLYLNDEKLYFLIENFDLAMN